MRVRESEAKILVRVMMYTRLKETVVGWVDNVVVFSLLLRSVVVKRWKVIVAGLCVALATLAGFRVWNTRWGTETAGEQMSMIYLL